jgi:hypothetical protein
MALLLAASLTTPTGARALSAGGFEYIVTESGATVIRCAGSCPATLIIPSTLDGHPVTSIGNAAFYFVSLASVSIPNSVTSIGNRAFDNSGLTSVTIPNSVTSLDDYAFSSNFLTSLVIPDSVLTIGYAAFFNNRLSTVTFGASVTSIGGESFRSNALTVVTIPRSVTSIDAWAFSDNTLENIYFLGNAPTAGDSVFLRNSGLSSVTRSSTATGWGSTWSDMPVVTDELPPETSLDVTPNSMTSSLVASFEFSGSDDRSPVTFECSVDGESYVSCASPFSTPTLSVGPHMFAVRAVDAVGNIDLTPASYTWTIESGLPPTNRDGLNWSVALVVLAGLTAAAGIGLRVRGAKRA